MHTNYNELDWLSSDCQYCDGVRRSIIMAEKGPQEGFFDSLSVRMILCTECGNKRCPKATWHGYECTHSNEPGQEGSSY